MSGSISGKHAVLSFLLIFLSSISTQVQASMFSEFERSIAGTVTKIRFVEEEFMTAEPGMSGTLGIDRAVPAHYVITLRESTSGRVREIILFRDQNDPEKTRQLEELGEGMNIEISGYNLRGDEGNYFEAYFEEMNVIEEKL